MEREQKKKHRKDTDIAATPNSGNGGAAADKKQVRFSQEVSKEKLSRPHAVLTPGRSEQPQQDGEEEQNEAEFEQQVQDAYAPPAPPPPAPKKARSEFSELHRQLSSADAIRGYVKKHRDGALKDAKQLLVFLQAISNRPSSVYEELFKNEPTRRGVVSCILERIIESKEEAVRRGKGAAAARQQQRGHRSGSSNANTNANTNTNANSSSSSEGGVSMLPPLHEFVIRCTATGVGTAEWEEGGGSGGKAEEKEKKEGGEEEEEVAEEQPLLSCAEMLQVLRSRDAAGRLQRQIEMMKTAREVKELCRELCGMPQGGIQKKGEGEDHEETLTSSSSSCVVGGGEKAMLFSRLISKVRRLASATNNSNNAATETAAAAAAGAEPSSSPQEKEAPQPLLNAKAVKKAVAYLLETAGSLQNDQQLVLPPKFQHFLTWVIQGGGKQSTNENNGGGEEQEDNSSPSATIVTLPYFGLSQDYVDMIAKFQNRGDTEMEQKATQLEVVMGLKTADTVAQLEEAVAPILKQGTQVFSSEAACSPDVLSVVSVACERVLELLTKPAEKNSKQKRLEKKEKKKKAAEEEEEPKEGISFCPPSFVEIPSVITDISIALVKKGKDGVQLPRRATRFIAAVTRLQKSNAKHATTQAEQAAAPKRQRADDEEEKEEEEEA